MLHLVCMHWGGSIFQRACNSKEDTDCQECSWHPVCSIVCILCFRGQDCCETFVITLQSGGVNTHVFAGSGLKSTTPKPHRRRHRPLPLPVKPAHKVMSKDAQPLDTFDLASPVFALCWKPIGVDASRAWLFVKLSALIFVCPAGQQMQRKQTSSMSPAIQQRPMWRI